MDTLFDPTPRDAMRPLSTDRPDTTESPISVDAGHVQVELSLVDVTIDGGGATTAVAPVLVKFGLLPWSDLQLGWTAYETGGGASGVGDAYARLKMNVWGNDGGDTALAVMPYVTVPTGSGGVGSGAVEGGVIVPFGFALPAGFAAAVMPEIDIVRTGDAYALDLVHTATCSHAIVGPAGGYLEYAGFADLSGAVPYRGFVDAGLTVGLGDDVQLDAGGRFGVTAAAEDVGLFAGVSFRR